MQNEDETKNTTQEKPILGLGGAISSGLQMLAKFAKKMDTPKEDKGVLFTKQDLAQLHATFKAMDAAISENQQRIDMLESQVAALKAATSQINPVKVRRQVAEASRNSMPPPPPPPGARLTPPQEPWQDPNTPKSKD